MIYVQPAMRNMRKRMRNLPLCVRACESRTGRAQPRRTEPPHAAADGGVARRVPFDLYIQYIHDGL